MLNEREHLFSSEREGLVCRNCHETDKHEYISPCSCSGTIRWVHRRCLDEWRSVSTNPESFYRCDICKFDYKFRTIEENEQGYPRVKVALLILLDMFILLLVWQAIVWVCVGLVFAIDSGDERQKLLPSLTYWQANYVSGLALFFVIFDFVCLIFALVKLSGCLNEREYSHSTYPYNNWTYAPSCYFFTFGWGYNNGPSGCGGCAGLAGSTGNCNGGGAKNCGAVLVPIIIALVVIGAILAITFALYFFYLSYSKHVEVLHNRIRTKHQIVVDLSQQSEV